MSDDWDADDFEPPPPVVQKEAPKTFWDDEDVEEEQAPSVAATQPSGEKKKKKKKEEELPQAAVKDESLTDPVAEKLRQQRLVEESDFKATKELFGSSKAAERSLDDFIPKSEAEFTEYAELLAGKITPFSKSFHYVNALKSFLRKATATLSSAEAKELQTAMSVVANEKLKAEKEATAGKKKSAAKKQQLKVDKEDDVDDFRGGGGGRYIDDDYDFM